MTIAKYNHNEMVRFRVNKVLLSDGLIYFTKNFTVFDVPSDSILPI